MLQGASCEALGDLCGCPGRLLGAFWVLSEASGRPIKASRKLLGTPSGILEPSGTRPLGVIADLDGAPESLAGMAERT